jgi:ATP-dependent helicase/nuclease subunit A
MRQVERSEIGTIHSFAATLLRLYPMEAGIDPQFLEDDGSRFERHFEESWIGWLDQELSDAGARRAEWKETLKKAALADIREIALALCSEAVPLEQLSALFRDPQVPPPVDEWLRKLGEKGAELCDRHPEGRFQIDRLAGAALTIVREFSTRGALDAARLEEERQLLEAADPRIVKEWSEEEFERARELIRIARRLCRVDHGLLRRLLGLLLPFVKDCRESFLRQGWISFDGLLVRARDLVRDHTAVREELKRHFKAILIDEFQDTDPIQYEILLYLSEAAGTRARRWREVRVTPGKIFVVGDPKQSIYAFRRADIQAYLEVVKEVIEAKDGVELNLVQNFRSHAAILDAVNGVFERLIRPREGLQPPYIAIHPPRLTEAPFAGEAKPLPFRRVFIRRVEGGAGPLGAEQARRLEAESLARWLDEEVLDRAEIFDRDGRRNLAEAKDVAILLRVLTDVHFYLEPLRRRGIRYVVEGERHFYATQEVVDAVNLLRAVDNPYDRSSLVGLLRSSVGGLTDAEIYALSQASLLDYRALGLPGDEAQEKLRPLVKDLYETLNRLHAETRKLPVGEAVSQVFASVPVRLLAASSFNAEQAVANLEKVRLQAEIMGREGLGTLKEVIATLQRRVFEIKEEGESLLAEENVDAVKILSVHKAKGLEFPIVVVAGCQGTIDQREESVGVDHDWSSGLVGLRMGETWSLPGVLLSEKRRAREREEQKRVLYVAMTRAREHLTLSSAAVERPQGASFLAMLKDSVGDLDSPDDSTTLRAGSGSIEFRRVREPEPSPRPRKKSAPAQRTMVDWQAYEELWRRRQRDYERALAEPRFLTPTALKRREADLIADATRPSAPSPASSDALLIGELTHAFLQDWNFQSEPENFPLTLARFLTPRLAESPARDHARIRSDLEGILATFLASETYRELRSAEILGRETPFLMPWNDRIMEGVIDLLYEHDGLLYIADYKTDRIEKADLAKAAETYRHQIEIYSEAVRRTLKRDVAGFKFIFLRLGEAFEVRL